MADISLTASMRSNLLSLQQTQSLMDTTQERLSTGKKVNSAIDNPSSYYAAQSLTNRASDLSALLDSMGQAIQTIQAADEGIKTITEFAEQAKAVANSARDEAVDMSSAKLTIGALAAGKSKAAQIDITINNADGTAGTPVTVNIEANKTLEEVKASVLEQINKEGSGLKASFDDTGALLITAQDGATATVATTTPGDFTLSVPKSEPQVNESRQKLAAQFDSILAQIDKVANDSSYKGVNLLQGNDLKVVFNEDRSSDLVVEGKDASSAGLKIAASANGWQTDADIDASITQIEDAIKELRTMSSEFGNNYSIVQSRETFTENLINVLEEGSDKLTLADMNEESANMLALQTRQQLAINSLSLASQAAQSVLKLF